MGFNIFLFLFSAYIVFDTTKTGSKMTSCGPKTNFHLYLRLAVIMGLTWITGLVPIYKTCAVFSVTVRDKIS
jgi:hypothetical protein